MDNVIYMTTRQHEQAHGVIPRAIQEKINHSFFSSLPLVIKTNGIPSNTYRVWGVINISPPHVIHLAKYSKKQRVRKKNIKRSKKYELF